MHRLDFGPLPLLVLNIILEHILQKNVGRLIVPVDLFSEAYIYIYIYCVCMCILSLRWHGWLISSQWEKKTWSCYLRKKPNVLPCIRNLTYFVILEQDFQTLSLINFARHSLYILDFRVNGKKRPYDRATFMADKISYMDYFLAIHQPYLQFMAPEALPRDVWLYVVSLLTAF